MNFLLTIIHLYIFIVVDTKNHDFLQNPVLNLCKNTTCPYRHSCNVVFQVHKQNFIEKCQCFCINKEACNPTNFTTIKCYCDKKHHGVQCSMPKIDNEKCDRNNLENFCKPNCQKTRLERHICDNIKIDPWKTCPNKKSCIQKYNNGKCDLECNNKDCLFDGTDCQSTNQCLGCNTSPKLYDTKPQCYKICRSIDCYIGNSTMCELYQRSNKPKHPNAYMIVQFQATYGLIITALKTLLYELSLKFGVVIEVAYNSDMKPIIYSLHSNRFSEINTVVVFKIYNYRCISWNCITDPTMIAKNLMASSYLNRDTLPFKVVKATGYFMVKPYESFNLKHSFISGFFIIATVVASSILVGMMYFVEHNRRINHTSSSTGSSSSCVISGNNNNNNQENDILFNDYVQKNNNDIHFYTPAATAATTNSNITTSTANNTNVNQHHHNGSINANDTTSCRKRPPTILQHTSPSDEIGENSKNSNSPTNDTIIDFNEHKITKYENYSQPFVISHKSLLTKLTNDQKSSITTNNDFGNWNALINYPEKCSGTEPYPLVVYNKNGVKKTIVSDMNWDLFPSVIPEKLMINCHSSVSSSCANINPDSKCFASNATRLNNKILNKIGHNKYEGIDVRINTVVHDAIKNNILINLEHLSRLDILFMEMKNDQSFSPLILSVIYSQYEWIELLSNNGVSLDSHDKNGWRAVHWAAALDDLKAIKILHHCRANLDVTSNIGETPLMIACKESSLNVLIFLLNTNVCLIQNNFMHQSCVDIAIKYNRLAVLGLLYRHIKSKTNCRDASSRMKLKVIIEIYFSQNPTFINKLKNRITNILPTNQFTSNSTSQQVPFPNTHLQASYDSSTSVNNNNNSNKFPIHETFNGTSTTYLNFDPINILMPNNNPNKFTSTHQSNTSSTHNLNSNQILTSNNLTQNVHIQTNHKTINDTTNNNSSNSTNNNNNSNINNNSNNTWMFNSNILPNYSNVTNSVIPNIDTQQTCTATPLIYNNWGSTTLPQYQFPQTNIYDIYKNDQMQQLFTNTICPINNRNDFNNVYQSRSTNNNKNQPNIDNIISPPLVDNFLNMIQAQVNNCLPNTQCENQFICDSEPISLQNPIASAYQHNGNTTTIYNQEKNNHFIYNNNFMPLLNQYDHDELARLIELNESKTNTINNKINFMPSSSNN